MEKIYKIPVDWRVFGDMYVKANSLEEAKDKALSEQPLPTESTYLEGSFNIDENQIKEYKAEGELVQEYLPPKENK